MATAKKTKDIRLGTTIVACLLVFLMVLGLRVSGALEQLELTAYDWQVRFRPADPGPDKRVALVEITEQDIQQLGQWPMSDAVMAQALQTLVDAGVRVVGVDIYRDLPVPPGHNRLRSVLKKNPQIIMTLKFPHEDSPGVGPPPVLEGSNRVGFTDMMNDPDGIVRRGLLYLDNGKRITYALGVRTMFHYLQEEGIPVRGDPDNPAHIRLGETTLPPFEANDGVYVGADVGGYQFLVDYPGAPREFASITFSQLLSKQFDASQLAGKLVLVGATAESLRDNFFTPYNRNGLDAKAMWGVVLHANIASQLLGSGIDGRQPIAVIDDFYESAWILFWTLLGAITAVYVRTGWHLALIGVGQQVLLLAAIQGAFMLGWWLPSVPAGLGWLSALGLVEIYLSNREKRERANLMNLFSRHISPQLADLIWNERESFVSGGRPRPQKLTATAFFTDIVGFTPTSEKFEPQELIDWLNEYMEAVAPAVGDHQGVILRFVGDAIVAAFGIPVARTTDQEIREDAMRAVNCALDMQARLIEHNRGLQQRGLPMVGMRIGIFSGPMTAGSLGSALRLEYTIIGDTVNTAARLENYNKESFVPEHLVRPCRILIGQSTYELVGDRYVTEAVGEAKLKGKSQGLAVYSVLGALDSASEKSAAPLPTENREPAVAGVEP